MDHIILFLAGVLEITFLDLALCGDNIGVIALATRNLSHKNARRASAIGIGGAIALRIYFASIITVFLGLKWLPIKFVGGLILIKVTWDLIKPQNETRARSDNHSEKFWDAVLSVIVADISMSLDNVLAIASAANGNIALIVFGILLNIPIIFFGSQFVVTMMKRHPIVIYIGGAILAFTSMNMILDDYWLHQYINLTPELCSYLPLIAGGLTLIYGIFMINHDSHNSAGIQRVI